MSAAKSHKINTGDDQLPQAVALPAAPTVSPSAHATTHAFAPAQGIDTLKDAHSMRLNVEVFTNTIMTQPTMGHLTGVPEIQVHEATAKLHAARWTSDIAISILEANEFSIHFANLFTNFMSPLTAAADAVIDNEQTDGDSTDVAATKAAAAAAGTASLKSGLMILRRQLTRQQARAAVAATTLDDFVNDITKDVSDFSTDMGTVQATYMGDQGQLQQIRDQITVLHQSLSRDLAAIGLGAGGIAAGGLVIAFGLLMEIPTAGTSTAIVLSGIGVAAVGGVAVTAGSVDYANSTRELAECTRQLSTLTAEVAIADVLRNNINGLREKAGKALLALEAMVTQWQILENTIQSVHDSVDKLSATEVDYIKGSLATAAQDWASMRRAAEAIALQMNNLQIVNVHDAANITTATPSASPPPSAIGTFVNPLVLGARTLGADAPDTTISNWGLVDALSHVERDIAHLLVDSNGPGMAGLPHAEELCLQMASLHPVQQDLLDKLAAITKAHGDIGHHFSEPDNSVVLRATERFLATLSTGYAAAQVLAETSLAAYRMSTDLMSKALALIDNTTLINASDTAKVQTLQSAIEAVQATISGDNELIEHASFVSQVGLDWPMQFIAEKLGQTLGNQGHILMKLADETRAVETEEGDLAKQLASLAWITDVHADVFNVTSSSFNVTTKLDTMLRTGMASLGNMATSGARSMAPIMAVSQHFSDLEAIVIGSEVSALPLGLAHTSLKCGPVVALSMPAAAPVEFVGAPATTTSSLSGSGDALADILALLGDLCGQVWIGGGASLVVDSQPRLSLSLLPTIGETQALAASHAQEWARIVRKEIIDVTIGVRGFSAASEGAVSVMLELIRTGAGDQRLETELLQGIEILGSRLETLTDVLTNGAAGAIPAVSAMRQEINNDTVRVGSLRMQLSNTYTGPDGEIARMKATVKASSTQITAMNKAIANRATGQLGEFYKQGFIIAAGVGLASVGVPLGPVIGGIASTATVATCSKFATRAVNAAGKSVVSSGSEAALETINGSDQHNVAAAIDQYGAELVQLKHDELQVGAFLMLAQSVEELGSSVGETVRILMKLSISVASLVSELKVLRALIRDKSSARAVKDKLVAMKAGHSENQLNAKAATKSIIFSA